MELAPPLPALRHLKAGVRGVVPTATAVAGAALLFALPALWNGFPLVFFDTVDYVRTSFTGEAPPYRTVPYGVFLAATHLGVSLWLPVAVQSLVLAYVLHEGLAVFAPVRPHLALVPTAALLVAFTGLPWYTSQIMPDAFVGVAALGTATLVFGRARLGPCRRLALAAAVAVATSLHTSHLFLLFGLAASAAVLVPLARRAWPGVRLDWATSAVGSFAALALVLATQWALAGRPTLGPPGSVFLLARLVQDGLAQRYLDDVCPPPGEDAGERQATGLKLCAVRHRLPAAANQFLWNPHWGGDSPFLEVGGWEGMAEEAAEIVVGSLRAYPLAHAAAALKNTGLQLVKVRVGDGLEPMDWLLGDDIARYLPADAAAFGRARQQTGIEFGLLNGVQVPVLLGSMAGAAFLLAVGWRRRDPRSAGLAAAVLLALLGNAFICGVFSNPIHRYQSRIAWIAVFAVAVGAARLAVPEGRKGAAPR